MVNPTSYLKIAAAGRKFGENHPKFSAFIRTITAQGLEEGTVLELKVTRADGTSMTGNMKVTKDDLDLVRELKNISGE